MKKSILTILLFAVFLVVFNVLFFVLGDNAARQASVWISYGFIHFAYLLFLISMFTIRRGPAQDDYAAPTVYVTWKYFVIELFAGIIFILINAETIVWALTVQTILAAIAVLMWLIHLMANEHTADAMERHTRELVYVRECSSLLKGIMQHVSDSKLQKAVENCYDEISTSPVRSMERVKPIECDVLHAIKELDDAVQAKDAQRIKGLTADIIRLAKDRNRIIQQFQ